MKRDFELLKKIVAEIADADGGCSSYSLTFPGEYDDGVVFEHVELLIDAGLVVGDVHRSFDGIHGVSITRLTSDGQDFLDAAAKQTLWNKAFAVVKEKGGAMTLDVLTRLLQKLAESQVGLS